MGWNLELRVWGLQPTAGEVLGQDCSPWLGKVWLQLSAAAMEIHPRALWLRGTPACGWRWALWTLHLGSLPAPRAAARA